VRCSMRGVASRRLLTSAHRLDRHRSFKERTSEQRGKPPIMILGGLLWQKI